MEKITYEQIKPYIEKRLVSMARHPEDGNVAIFNYSQTCQFEQAWDEITRQCRGLILNIETGEILARPFPKFFNYGEHVSKGWAIPIGKPIVSEKLDGSLGILYSLNGKSAIATRGSFTSDQALWATEWWRKNVEEGDNFEPNTTNLFEIIYPANRIVVNYDFSGLVHLTTLDNKTGQPVDVSWGNAVRKVTEVPYTDMETLEKMDEPNSEGFVLYYPDDNVRMKIKFPEYVRLHKLITGVSEIAIWEHLRDGNNLEDLLEKVADEFYKWVQKVQEDLWGKFIGIEKEARIVFEGIKNLPTRKEQAIELQKRTTNTGVVFALLDGKPHAHIIWKMLRPHGKSSFKVDIDS